MLARRSGGCRRVRRGGHAPGAASAPEPWYRYSVKVIRNTTRRPLRVPLGQGKVLHLGPGKTGEVAPSATERPAFVRLVEQGQIELVEEDAQAAPGSGGAARVQESTHALKRGRVQRTGDR